MMDREKRERIVREFERFIQEYYRDIGYTSYDIEVLKGALALLKAQEAVKPVWMGNDMRIGFYACGACGMNMGTNPNYCWYCGRKVKWE